MTSPDFSPHLGAAASTLNEMKAVTDDLAAAWSVYVPAWTSSGTPPALGDGTLTGAYIQVGSLVIGRIGLTVGSTTTFGTGTYRFSVPADILVNSVCVARLADASTGFFYRGTARITTPGAGLIDQILFSDANTGWSGTVPITLAVGDVAQFAFVYDANV